MPRGTPSRPWPYRLPFPLLRHLLPQNYYERPAPSYIAPWPRDPVDFPSRTRHPIISRILDWLIILLLLIGTELFYNVVEPPKRYFRLDDTSLQYPVVPEIISSSITPVFTIILPLIIMLIFEILFFYDPWNLYHLCTGFAETQALNLFFTSIIWIYLGDFRPTFLTKCQPDMSRVVPGRVYYQVSDICTQHLAKDEFHAFPSGHASSAWSGFGFFALYMLTKTKGWSPAAQFWKVLFFFVVPLSAALWITTTRVIDYHHKSYQVIWGSIIGTLAALAGYTRNFTGLWTWRNHVPARYAFHNPESASSIELTAATSDDVEIGRHQLRRSASQESQRQSGYLGAGGMNWNGNGSTVRGDGHRTEVPVGVV
ncbi:hypothetical protein HDV00_012297 [Rhizophlyctis rosea]|nr:hypothetical protein HDV00_012297 [Rhizophlyctis rosea]